VAQGLAAVQSQHRLPGGLSLLIREAVPEDAAALLGYIEAVSAESEFLTFAPGEFTLSVAAEAEVLRQYAQADNQLYLLGLTEQAIVAVAILSASTRARIRHSGELAMSVRRQYWGRGVGSVMLDTLIGWARATGIISKINLRVRADNQRALRLYQRKGFVLEGTLRREMRVGERYFDNHCLGFEL
jgi:RimJ/RimL family protein N-acetyltransferase